MKVVIRGAGVAGLTLAHELAVRGTDVKMVEQRSEIAGNASWQAGGMLAPWCERENADEAVLTLGREAADWWDAALPGHVVRKGTLVVAPARDSGELDRFARRTTGFKNLTGDDVAQLEPVLAGRFGRGLLFAEEAHLDPRAALLALHDKLVQMGVRIAFNSSEGADCDCVADCTGIAGQQPDLRGVRGEMLILRTGDVALQRPVRLLHPRFPVYVVPRADGHFMIGATMIESAASGPISARSTMELLSAAYAMHPGFGEAELVETGTAVRPAFPDHLPRVERVGRDIRINGLYRHGFLLAPALARRAAKLILDA